jgi:HSP20 family protein
MLMRFDPFRELDRLTDELWNSRPATRTFPMDAYRRGDRFFVHFDLPGVDASTIDVTVEKNVLTVTGERGWSPQEGDEILVHERPRGTFQRQLFLGDTLDPSGLEANYDAGVLTLTIPVAEVAKPRKVEIKVGDTAAAIETTGSETQAA